MNTRNIAIGVAVIIALGVSMYFFSNTQDPQLRNGTLQEGEHISEVTWGEAVQFIENCEVEMLFQSHALDVELDLKDGSRVHTKEPAIDEVFKVYDGVREKCGTIPMATE